MEWQEKIYDKIENYSVFNWGFKIDSLMIIWSKQNLITNKLYYLIKNSKIVVVRIIKKYKANKSFMYHLEIIEIVSDLKSLEVKNVDGIELVLKKRLRGFKNIVDDNKYFSKIPLKNSIVHVDNGITFIEGIEVDFLLNKDKNKWSDFLITFDYDFIPEEKRKEIMLLCGHENPER